MNKDEKFRNLDFKKKFIHNIWSIMTRTQIQKKILLKIGIRKIIDLAEKRGYFEVYENVKDSYWNELPLVIEYINKNTTGNKNISWQKDILTRFKDYLPFKRVLVTGCGNGWLERDLFDLGIGKNFYGLDISERFLKIAKSLVDKRAIHYFKADLNNLSLQHSHYDAIFNVSVLHHVQNLSLALKEIAYSLKPNGLVFNYEYVGPRYYQYTDKHIYLMKKINNQLPSKFRTQHNLRSLKEDFELGDKTEAISSNIVKNEVKKFFEIIYERNLNGGIAYQILWNNIKQFEIGDEKSKKVLEFILKKDLDYSREGKIPNLHWYSVGKPKQFD